VHGVGGVWGTLATGIFAQKTINEAGANGLLFGNYKLFLVQGLYALTCVVYAIVVTWILFKFIDYMMGLRVNKKDELVGLDLTQHSEAAYTVIE
jgi:Amt family ammonium transporter